MTQLVVERLVKRQQAHTVLTDITLQVEPGEFVVFVGPSGCGKTTLLRILAGLESLDGGAIRLNGKDISHASPGERGVAMVFQSYALYPHLSVYENLAFPLRVARQSAAEIDRRVLAAAGALQLTPYLKRKPGLLSGGQRQRVAIGRAIVREPALFLFDEPLSNLDAALRADMRRELISLHRSLGATTLYVTHDQVEAMTMADRIVVLNEGRVEQIGTPEQLYFQPVNLFVAQFLGHPKINVLDAECHLSPGGERQLTIRSLAGWTMPAPAGLPVGAKLQLAVRPEQVAVMTLPVNGDPVEADPSVVAFQVASSEWLGGQTVLYGDIAGQPFCCVTPRRLDRQQVSHLAITLPRQHILLFDACGERLVTPPAL